MQMKKSILAVALLLITSVAVFTACSKNKETTKLDIQLTDNPYNAQEVNVDIKEVRVNFSDDSSGWVTLNTFAGVYNLLGLQNGLDTLIASATVTTGTVKEIRFILGSNNSIKINDVVFPLTIPSGSESGLKIKVNKKLAVGFDFLLIDFDAALSILQVGTGDFKLKPVLKLK
jgi:hypothetical protein